MHELIETHTNSYYIIYTYNSFQQLEQHYNIYFT